MASASPSRRSCLPTAASRCASVRKSANCRTKVRSSSTTSTSRRSTTRRAETTVELGSGQSFMIAGLLRNRNTNNIDKAPFLGDLPILGALFRSTSFRRDETELVIIVTPYLVRPVSGTLAAADATAIAPRPTPRASGKARRYSSQGRLSGSGSGSGARLRRRRGRRNPGVQAVIRRFIRKDATMASKSALLLVAAALSGCAYKPGTGSGSGRRSGQRAGRQPRGLCVRRSCSERLARSRRKQPGSTPGSAASTFATATASTSTVAPIQRPRASQVARDRRPATACWSPRALRSPPARLLRAASGSSSAARSRAFRIARTGTKPSQPNYNNKTMPNFGCGVNAQPRGDGRQPRGPGPRARGQRRRRRC